MKRKWLKYTMLLLSIGVLGIVSYYTYSIIQFSNHISTAVKPAEETDSAHNEVVEIPKWEGKERINILLIGGDSRGDDAGRSDTMLVASIDPVTKRAHLFSLLRDTYVEIPGMAKDG